MPLNFADGDMPGNAGPPACHQMFAAHELIQASSDGKESNLRPR